MGVLASKSLAYGPVCCRLKLSTTESCVQVFFCPPVTALLPQLRGIVAACADSLTPLRLAGTARPNTGDGVFSRDLHQAWVHGVDTSAREDRQLTPSLPVFAVSVAILALAAIPSAEPPAAASATVSFGSVEGRALTQPRRPRSLQYHRARDEQTCGSHHDEGQSFSHSPRRGSVCNRGISAS